MNGIPGCGDESRRCSDGKRPWIPINKSGHERAEATGAEVLYQPRRTDSGGDRQQRQDFDDVAVDLLRGQRQNGDGCDDEDDDGEELSSPMAIGEADRDQDHGCEHEPRRHPKRSGDEVEQAGRSEGDLALENAELPGVGEARRLAQHAQLITGGNDDRRPQDGDGGGAGEDDDRQGLEDGSQPILPTAPCPSGTDNPAPGDPADQQNRPRNERHGRELRQRGQRRQNAGNHGGRYGALEGRSAASQQASEQHHGAGCKEPEEFVGVEDGAVPHEERLGRHEEPDGHGRNGTEPLPGEPHEQPDQQAGSDCQSDLGTLQTRPGLSEGLIGNDPDLLAGAVEDPSDRADDHRGHPRQGGHLIARRSGHAGQVGGGERVRVPDRPPHPHQFVVGQVVAGGQHPRNERADSEETGDRLGVQHTALRSEVGDRRGFDFLHDRNLVREAWYAGCGGGDHRRSMAHSWVH